jgi:hypothetical protein
VIPQLGDHTRIIGPFSSSRGKFHGLKFEKAFMSLTILKRIDLSANGQDVSGTEGLSEY